MSGSIKFTAKNSQRTGNVLLGAALILGLGVLLHIGSTETSLGNSHGDAATPASDDGIFASDFQAHDKKKKKKKKPRRGSFRSS